MPTESGLIGYMYHGHIIVCPECVEKHLYNDVPLHKGIPFFHSNIDRYWQSCHVCHNLLHKAENYNWPELFVSTSFEVDELIKVYR